MVRTKVRFADFRFSYDGEEQVLRGVNFRVCKSDVIVFVGHTGVENQLLCPCALLNPQKAKR